MMVHLYEPGISDYVTVFSVHLKDNFVEGVCFRAGTLFIIILDPTHFLKGNMHLPQ